MHTIRGNYRPISEGPPGLYDITLAGLLLEGVRVRFSMNPPALFVFYPFSLPLASFDSYFSYFFRVPLYSSLSSTLSSNFPSLFRFLVEPKDSSEDRSETERAGFKFNLTLSRTVTITSHWQPIIIIIVGEKHRAGMRSSRAEQSCKAGRLTRQRSLRSRSIHRYGCNLSGRLSGWESAE